MVTYGSTSLGNGYGPLVLVSIQDSIQIDERVLTIPNIPFSDWIHTSSPGGRKEGARVGMPMKPTWSAVRNSKTQSIFKARVLPHQLPS